MSLETIDLVTTGGDVIHIEIPEDIAEEVTADFNDARSNGGWWFVGNWSDVRASYKGHALSEINMALIIGSR